MAESGIFGISSSVRSIWHGSGILYRQLLISLQWDLEIFWDLDIFTSMNFELTVQDPRPMPNCSYWCADSKNTTFDLVPFFHARCSNFRAVPGSGTISQLGRGADSNATKIISAAIFSARLLNSR